MSFGQNHQNRPFYFAAPKAVCYSPRPSPDRTGPNPAEIIPHGSIPPRGPPGGPEPQNRQKQPRTYPFFGIQTAGRLPPIPMPPPGWSRRTNQNNNRRPRS